MATKGFEQTPTEISWRRWADFTGGVRRPLDKFKKKLGAVRAWSLQSHVPARPIVYNPCSRVNKNPWVLTAEAFPFANALHTLFL